MGCWFISALFKMTYTCDYSGSGSDDGSTASEMSDSFLQEVLWSLPHINTYSILESKSVAAATQKVVPCLSVRGDQSCQHCDQRSPVEHFWTGWKFHLIVSQWECQLPNKERLRMEPRPQHSGALVFIWALARVRETLEPIPSLNRYDQVI